MIWLVTSSFHSPSRAPPSPESPVERLLPERPGLFPTLSWLERPPGSAQPGFQGSARASPPLLLCDGFLAAQMGLTPSTLRPPLPRQAAVLTPKPFIPLSVCLSVSAGRQQGPQYQKPHQSPRSPPVPSTERDTQAFPGFPRWDSPLLSSSAGPKECLRSPVFQPVFFTLELHVPLPLGCEFQYPARDRTKRLNSEVTQIWGHRGKVGGEDRRQGAEFGTC